jgi:hypothetical protein
MIADERGNVFKTFGHLKIFTRPRWTSQVSGSIFYHYGENTMFFETFVDTIYHVTKVALTPQYHLNMGKYTPPYEKQYEMFKRVDSPMNQYFYFHNIGETDLFLFFDFTYKKANSTASSPSSFFGYYDKKRKTVKIADVDKNGRRIINNIDHFGAIQLSSWTINHERNEMVSYIEAVDIVAWFKQNPQKAKELPANLQKLSKLTDDDDPVVVIAKLKQ